MRRTLSAAAAALCLFASAPAFAQNDQPDSLCDGLHCEFVTLDGLDIQGDAASSTGTHLYTRPPSRFDRQASLARSFSPELQASLDDAALDP